MCVSVYVCLSPSLFWQEAVTDGRKRALRLFGNLLGNCVYNKAHQKSYKNIKETKFAEASVPPPPVCFCVCINKSLLLTHVHRLFSWIYTMILCDITRARAKER